MLHTWIDTAVVGMEQELGDLLTLFRQRASSSLEGQNEDAKTVLPVLMQLAANMIVEEPAFDRVAARLLWQQMQFELKEAGVVSLEQSWRQLDQVGLLSSFLDVWLPRVDQLQEVIDKGTPVEDLFTYIGLRTVYDRYLLRHPFSRLILEAPRHFMMRVACGLSTSTVKVFDLYHYMSRLAYLPSSPTLFNSGTRHPQMSSCYLLPSPDDSLEGIYKTYTDVAKLSKHAGGVAVAWHEIRSRGSLIRGTNGKSNGIIPWIKTLDSSVASVNQGGKRKGACCVYLSTWHADIEEFLELKDNTGDEARRAYNLNFANWVPDLFMQRVKQDGMWSLFDPKDVPDLNSAYDSRLPGAPQQFTERYCYYESQGLAKKTIKARDLYTRMLRMLAQTGNGWMTFKDACISKCNQISDATEYVQSSNLCTEITEVSSAKTTAVCNLGSINLSAFVKDGRIDYTALGFCVRTAVYFLDRVIDLNFYPIPESQTSNKAWRPIGLGLMGWQDALFKLQIPFDSAEANTLAANVQEWIYFHALSTSVELAEDAGGFPQWERTQTSKGLLQFDLWGVKPSLVSKEQWRDLKVRMIGKERNGSRNSLLIAIAPTATIATIAGCSDSVEPQVSNLFKRETLSGEFLQVNRFLVRSLKEKNLWTPTVREKIRQGEGSIQHIAEIPESYRRLYRTAWELPQRALIDQMAARGPFIDQSASLNLFIADPNIGKLSSMYMYAWEKGLKTTYYLRSRPATSIARATALVTANAAAAVSCSLENPESCEACQ